MPRKYEMSWDGKQGRWVKMYKGQRYSVACSVLGAPASKERSYQFANLWWDAKKKEIDAAIQAAPRALLPMEDATASALGIPPVDFFNRLLAFWMKHKPSEADARDAAERDAKGIIENVWRGLGQAVLENKSLPDGIGEHLPPARAAQVERGIKELRGEQVAAPDRTVKAHGERWLALQASLVAAKQLTAARCANNRTCLEHFQAFLGVDADIGTIDAAQLQSFYLHVLAKTNARREDKSAGWSIAYARDVFSVAKAFIRWAWEQGAIELPKNIDSKSFRFGSPAKAVKTWTVAEFQTVVAASPGKLKLALLLMANIGATQQDISDLRDDEVDWQEGRIIRKRSKTANHENVPTVNYKLWPLAFELLQKYRDGGERVLLTESGKPYVRTELRNGKLVKADGFASNFVHVKKRLKLQRSLKQLRKLGATLLEGHKDYGRFKSYFLAHSPRTVADRHYASPSQALFDEAVLWLGGQLRQA